MRCAFLPVRGSFPTWARKNLPQPATASPEYLRVSPGPSFGSVRRRRVDDRRLQVEPPRASGQLKPMLEERRHGVVDPDPALSFPRPFSEDRCQGIGGDGGDGPVDELVQA